MSTNRLPKNLTIYVNTYEGYTGKLFYNAQITKGNLRVGHSDTDIWTAISSVIKSYLRITMPSGY